MALSELCASRYLFFTNECVGLGHLQRALALAKGVTDAAATANALVVTGSPPPPQTTLPSRVDVVALPQISRDGDGRRRARRLAMPIDDLHRIRAHVALAVATAFAPDVVVVDKTPFGLSGELRDALAELRARSCRIVLGLRDIEDDATRVRAAWTAPGVRDDIEHFYDAILVYGPAHGRDALACAGWDDLAMPVHHVGYVGREQPAVGPVDAPEDFVLATVGGGADGYPVLARFLEALRLRPLGRRALVVAGPLMPASDVEELRRAADGLDVDVHSSRADVAQLAARARAVVTMAGYNTVGEVLRAGTPALLVPRTQPSAEQLIRARDLQAQGLADVLLLEDSDAAAMRDALDRVVARPAATAVDARPGVQRAAELLVGLAAARRGWNRFDVAVEASA